MNKKALRRSQRLYSLILKLYPKRYRQEFGEEMKYVFSQSLKDAYSENGEQGIFYIWRRTITDVGKSLVIQHIENLPHRQGNQKGGGTMKKNNDLIMQNKVFGFLALGTGLLLIIPLVLTLLNPTSSINGGVGGGWDWEAGDFVVMSILLFGMGSIYVFTARKVSKKRRLVVGLVVLAALLFIWAHLAVGIVDTWPLAGS
jgi:hypothetical protein